MTEEIQRYADAAMFRAEPMPTEGGRVVPRVTLLHMTADPLGAMAAPNMMYRGIVVRSLSDVPDEERRKVLTDMAKTRLTAPLEFVDLHFLIEGVDRAFTHQMVRQRTAVYAQESLRFGVKEGQPWREVCSVPEGIDDPLKRKIWQDALNDVQRAYLGLIDVGVPAEDARGLMPHAMTTRLHYKTNLRNLVDHAGNRLCTQAQFVWRDVFFKMVDAIRNYDDRQIGRIFRDWQYKAIADSWMFSPACYHTGKCEFMASADRFCAIRDRVELFHSRGVRPEWWDARQSDAYPATDEQRKGVPGIYPGEWMADPTAAREGGS
jgi:flavin-dependent thymidylate synthase